MKFINAAIAGMILTACCIVNVVNAEVITLNVQSMGYGQGNPINGYALLNFNGNDVLGGVSNRGVNIAVIDQNTGSLIDISSFDTYLNENNSRALVTYINNISAGRIVLLGVKDEATRYFESTAQSAIQSLGGSVNNINGIGFRDSYALIGIAGAGLGSRTAFEAYNADNLVSVTDTINVDVPEPSSLAILALGVMGLVSRRYKK